jgi:hypothetical protein
MSDMPERIFVESRPKVFSRDKDGNMRAEEVEYLRADLAPVIGYTERQVRTAMTMFSDTDHTMEEILATLTPASSVPVPTVEEIADHIDLWFRSGEDKPWNFLVEDLAGSIHALLTKGRGGV